MTTRPFITNVIEAGFFDILKNKGGLYEFMSQISNDQTAIESTNKWSEVLGQVIDRLMGKNMSATYEFQQLTIDTHIKEAYAHDSG
jgi:hypothetical protein